jgi:glycerol-3-phosphate dehydrogenase
MHTTIDCPQRPSLASLNQTQPWDVLVVGGGATGLGVALEAQLRGLRVLLVEVNDFASGSSSRSTKLLHGGVRYLAQGQWALVRQALRERATVLSLAPHLAQPLRFCVPLDGRWPLLRTAVGLGLYQAMAGRHRLGDLQRLGSVETARCLPEGVPAALGSLQYWDGQFEDARLALALARSAQAQGATVRNHTRLSALLPQQGLWQARLEDGLRGESQAVLARCIVQATGVWVEQLRELWPQERVGTGSVDEPRVTVSQGVHLVIPRARFPLQQALLVPQTKDGRVFFALPWLGAVVLGTTDTPRGDAPAEPRAFAHEIRSLMQQAEQSLGLHLRREDIRSIWVGLRPLVSDPARDRPTSSMSREHRIWSHAPGLHVVTGGKWTTYRQIGQEVVEHLCAEGRVSALKASTSVSHRLLGAPRLGAAAVPLTQAPGLHLWGDLAAEVQALPGGERHMGLGLSEAMVRYSARHEWAVTTEDMLARRWRALFLDASQARAMAPAVAELLWQENRIDPRLEDFLALCEHYQAPPDL